MLVLTLLKDADFSKKEVIVKLISPSVIKSGVVLFASQPD